MADSRAFPWAARFDADQLAAFLEDLWGAAAGDDGRATLLAVEKVIADHCPGGDNVPQCPLTDREIEVLTLMANGATYDSAARQLGVARDSVRSHCSRIYDRLGAANAAQATAIATRQGWLPGLQVPEPVAPLRRLSPQEWNRVLQQRADEMRAQPGTPVQIGPYVSPTGASGTAWRIGKGLSAPFRPAGAFTAKAVRLARSRWAVEARYIGDHADCHPATPTERTAP